MNITVFGGAGFLGSHVADELTRRGHQVLVFDSKVSPFLQRGQEMQVGDILNERDVRKAVAHADVVYNFAALADLDQAKHLPIETIKINVLGNTYILEAIKSTKVRRFVFSSSIYVYSDAGLFYRSSKQACELFIDNYSKAYGLPYTILRYGSLYGPRSNESNWIYRMLKAALLEKKVIREGDGEEIREYIHVQDAARLSVDVLDEKYKNRCVIISGREQMKIKDLLTMVKEMLKNELEIEYSPAHHNEHYEITPYVFKPQMASKISGSEYVDLGQGILDLLGEIHSQYVVPQNK